MSKRAVIIPVVTLGVAAALLFTIQGCWTSWEGGRVDQQTDDAYVRADMAPLSTRISGTVRKVDVNDYEAVKPGQLLVELDDEDYRAVLEEAKAALAGAPRRSSKTTRPRNEFRIPRFRARKPA